MPRPPVIVGSVAIVALATLLATRRAGAADVTATYMQALDRAAHRAPDLAVARANEAVSRTGVGIAGVLPNPSISAGTSTQTARLSLGVSVPLLILGQRGASIDASQAELATAGVEIDAAAADVRAGTAHAFVVLWHAQATAIERDRGAAVAQHLDDAVRGRVDLGAAASVDGLRAHAEHLRAAAEAQQAGQLVAAAGSDLGRWLDLGDDDVTVHASGDPFVPVDVPSLAALRGRVAESPAVRRERADARAAEARANRERALVRPALTLDLGADVWDSTLCPAGPCSNPPVNYRGALGIEVPLMNQRGPYVDRELAAAAAAHSRETAARVRLDAALTTAYRTFEAWTASARALGDGVVPAADAAAAATQESYTLGRATLVMVLDAVGAGIDARLALLEARAQQADAWIEVEHAMGIE